MAFVLHNNALLANARPDQITTVVTARATPLPLGVVAAVVGLGAGSDLVGLSAVATAVAPLSWAVVLLVTLSGRAGHAPGGG